MKYGIISAKAISFLKSTIDGFGHQGRIQDFEMGVNFCNNVIEPKSGSGVCEKKERKKGAQKKGGGGGG